MGSFVLHLQSAAQYQRIDEVVSFVGEDGSGSFGIMAGHARFMSCLSFGLARYRLVRGDWKYLALPGAVLYFRDNQLWLNTRRFVHGEDYALVSAALNEDIAAEERSIESLTHSLQRLEQEMFKRLWDIERTYGTAGTAR